MIDIKKMKQVHQYTFDNVWYLSEEQECVCIYCLERFYSSEIKDYTLDDTALCPYCGIDSVIGEKSGYTFSDIELEMIHEYFF